MLLYFGDLLPCFLKGCTGSASTLSNGEGELRTSLPGLLGSSSGGEGGGAVGLTLGGSGSMSTSTSLSPGMIFLAVSRAILAGGRSLTKS